MLANTTTRLKAIILKTPEKLLNTTAKQLYVPLSRMRQSRIISNTNTRSVTTVSANERTTKTAADIDGDSKEKQPDSALDSALPLSAMPGPRGLKNIPYIGTLFLFKPFSKFTLGTYGKLACHMHDQYGKVYRVRLGKNYAVHTSNVEDIEHIFRQEPKHPKRRLMNLGRIYRERCGLPQSLGSCNGEEWYALRKPLNVALKRPKAVQGYVPALNKVADDFIERLLEVKGENENEKAEEMFKLFFKYSSEGIGVACFNNRLGFLSQDLDNCPENKKLLEAFRTSVKCTFRDIMGLERRYLKTDKDKFYQTYYEAMSFIRQQSLKFMNKALPNSSATHQDVVGGDTDITPDHKSNLLKTLLGREDLNREQVLAIIDSMLIAGTDSTARILTVLLYDMALNPEIQARIAREVRAVAGPDGPITIECIEQVRLLRACMKESMRMHYPVSCGVERIMTRDTVISGYRVPAGISVFMTGCRTSQDPANFPDPTEFRPERWLKAALHRKPDVVVAAAATAVGAGAGTGSGTQDQTNDSNSTSSSSTSSSSSAFAFIPFGHGVRSCIGSRFAEVELLVGLAKVLQALDVSVHPSYKSLEVIYTPFITPVDPVPFIFTKR